MKYTNFKDLKLSQLGYGIMRLPTVETNGPVDENKAEELIRYAYENGVNYFDTAYIYHGGESERIIGKMLSRFPRDTWYLANKMPGNFLKIEDGKIKFEAGFIKTGAEFYNHVSEIFELQLRKCDVEYFDFYLLHNVSEETFDLYTDEKLGIANYLLEQKKLGRIKHFGFSTHAKPETLEKFLDIYDCFEFAQLQVNYLDWTLQDANKNHEILTQHGLPIIAMEPVRGGKLANPGKRASATLKAARPDLSPAAWAFRYLQELPNIAVVLSGMTTMEQVKENLEIFSKDDPMTESEKAALQKAIDEIATFVPCTSCRYCCDTCPQTLDIPNLIGLYNEAAYEFSWIVVDALALLSEEEKPAACIRCGVCTPHCPQNIDIPDILHKFAEIIEKNNKGEQTT